MRVYGEQPPSILAKMFCGCSTNTDGCISTRSSKTTHLENARWCYETTSKAHSCIKIILTIKLSERKRKRNDDLNNWSVAHEKYFISVMRQDTLRQMTQLCCNTCINSCIVFFLKDLSEKSCLSCQMHLICYPPFKKTVSLMFCSWPKIKL